MKDIDWFVDVIDLFFVESDLYEVEMSDAELCERAALDSLATYSVQNCTDDDTPVGKQVI